MIRQSVWFCHTPVDGIAQPTCRQFSKTVGTHATTDSEVRARLFIEGRELQFQRVAI